MVKRTKNFRREKALNHTKAAVPLKGVREFVEVHPFLRDAVPGRVSREAKRVKTGKSKSARASKANSKVAAEVDFVGNKSYNANIAAGLEDLFTEQTDADTSGLTKRQRLRALDVLEGKSDIWSDLSGPQKKRLAKRFGAPIAKPPRKGRQIVDVWGEDVATRVRTVRRSNPNGVVCKKTMIVENTPQLLAPSDCLAISGPLRYANFGEENNDAVHDRVEEEVRRGLIPNSATNKNMKAVVSLARRELKSQKQRGGAGHAAKDGLLLKSK